MSLEKIKFNVTSLTYEGPLQVASCFIICLSLLRPRGMFPNRKIPPLLTTDLGLQPTIKTCHETVPSTILEKTKLWFHLTELGCGIIYSKSFKLAEIVQKSLWRLY